MRKFKVVEGRHTEVLADGSEASYTAGEVVESEEDLAKKFPGKFVEVKE